MAIQSPKCTSCRYYRYGKLGPTPTCDAFPEGIPRDIWRGSINHEQPIPGDHGLQYMRATHEEQQAKLHAAAAERERREKFDGEQHP